MNERTGYMILFGLSLLATPLAVLVFFQNRKKYRQWNRADGKVIELIPQKSSSDSTLFAPRISFETASGETCEFVSSTASSPPPEMGATVGLLYDPQNPQKAIEDGFLSRHMIELLVFCFGLGGAVTCYLCLFE